MVRITTKPNCSVITERATWHIFVNCTTIMPFGQQLQLDFSGTSAPLPAQTPFSPPLPAVGDQITLIGRPTAEIFTVTNVYDSYCDVERLEGCKQIRKNVAFWKIRPSCSISAARPIHPAVAPTECQHQRAYFGLDAAFCPNCRQSFAPRSQVYKQLLEPKTAWKQWVEVCSIKRGRKIHQYFRYCYFDLAQGILKVQKLHVPGGCTQNPTAFARAEEIELAIQRKEFPTRILDLLKSWRQADERTKQLKKSQDQKSSPKQKRSRDPSNATRWKHWTEIYWVRRGNKKHQYYRYVWMEGRKIHRIHLPGGNIHSASAQLLLHETELAITSGATPHQIQEMIAGRRLL